MIIALGFWGVVAGYALAYTGVSWFVNGSTAKSLAANLGLQSTLIPQQSKTGTTSATSASNLAGYDTVGQALQASVNGPQGTLV